jgi:hypothetical protein
MFVVTNIIFAVGPSDDCRQLELHRCDYKLRVHAHGAVMFIDQYLRVSGDSLGASDRDWAAENVREADLPIQIPQCERKPQIQQKLRTDSVQILPLTESFG